MAKSIIEEALLEAEKLQESLRKNTKEILAATMRQEIDDIVKESFLSEQEEEVKETDVETEGLENAEDSAEVTEEENAGEESEVETEESSEENAEEALENAEEASEEVEEEETEDEAGLDTDVVDVDIDSMDDDSSQEIDMTEEPIGDVIKVFKKMGDNDEIEVVKDGSNVNLKDNTTGAEYQIHLGESSEAIYEIEMDEEEKTDEVEEGMCNECGSGMYEDSEEDENIYEIEMDDEDSEDEEEIEENKQHIKRNRYSTFGNNMKTGGRMEESHKAKINQLVSENEKLKTLVKEFESKQDEYKNALKMFRDKLNEIALFNTNLTYATKLFTEHSTTKQEKTNILKRFDSVVDLKESKNLYKVISEELVVRTPINESIDKKVNKTVSKGSMIKESTVYVDPQIKNIQSLMEKLDGRM